MVVLKCYASSILASAFFFASSKILSDFFKKELKFYLKEADLNPLGRKIIECCMKDGKLEDYVKLINSE